MSISLRTALLVTCAGLSVSSLAAAQEGISDDATIKYEAAVENEARAAAPPGAQDADNMFKEGLTDDATVRREAAVVDEAAAATPDPDPGMPYASAGASGAVPDEAVSAAVEDPYIRTVPQLLLVVNTTHWTERRAELMNVEVIDVISDKVFWVGQGPQQRALVVLDEQATPGTAVEGHYNIEPGMTVSVFGELAALPISADRRAALNLDKQTLSALDKGEVYLFAQKIAGVM